MKINIDTCNSNQTQFIEKVLKREIGFTVIEKMSKEVYITHFNSLAEILYESPKHDYINPDLSKIVWTEEYGFIPFWY